MQVMISTYLQSTQLIINLKFDIDLSKVKAFFLNGDYKNFVHRYLNKNYTIDVGKKQKLMSIIDFPTLF